MLEHGGRLRLASRRYGIAMSDWVDLSTGIAPWPYPVPEIPLSVWQRLPEDDDGLIDAAQSYYGAANLLPLNGSQAAILALPRLRSVGTVAVLAPSYGEYAPAWRAAGHRVIECAAEDLLQQDGDAIDVIMLANPNNPDGRCFSRATLLALAWRLSERNAWLIVDEAFADVDGENSLANMAGMAGAENVIVLRSLGKFFGLAGTRVGFCIAAPDVLSCLQETLGPWQLAHPSRFIAKAGLGDTAWQAAQKEKLRAASGCLATLLTTNGLPPDGGTALFQHVQCAAATALYERLAQRGILVRHFAEPCALRFGLPENETAWARLENALRQCGCPANS